MAYEEAYRDALARAIKDHRPRFVVLGADRGGWGPRWRASRRTRSCRSAPAPIARAELVEERLFELRVRPDG
jgi:hypothetical protein